jgi:hypothetical protein
MQLDFFTEGFNDDFQLVVKHLQLVPMQEKTSTDEILCISDSFFTNMKSLGGNIGGFLAPGKAKVILLQEN